MTGLWGLRAGSLGAADKTMRRLVGGAGLGARDEVGAWGFSEAAAGPRPGSLKLK